MRGPARISLSPVLWAQAFALVMGGCALLAHPDRWLYLGGLGLFAAVGVGGLARCILLASRVTVWEILLVSLCLGYGLGTLNTELTWIRGPADYLSLTMARPTYIVRATGWLMLLGAALCVAASLDDNRIFAGIKIDPAHQTLAGWTVVAVAVAAVAQVATGSIGFHQDMTGDTGRVSPLAGLTVSLLCPAAALASFCWKTQQGRRRLLMLACLATIMLIQFYQGRRVFIYTLVLCLMFFFAAHPPKRLFTQTHIVTMVVSVLLVMGVSKAFFALRMATWELKDAKDTVALVQKGFDILMDSKRSALDAEITENQNSRTFILGYLAELVDALQEHEPLYGDVLMFDVAMTVPSALWPEKYRVIYLGSEEVVANPHFRLPINDEANSIVTAGASDFGIVGIFLYPMGLAWVFSLMLRGTRKMGGMAHLMIAAALVNSVLNVEAATADYINIIRSISIVAIGVLGLLMAYRTLRRQPLLA